MPRKFNTCGIFKSPKFDLLHVSFPDAIFTFSLCYTALTYLLERAKKDSQKYMWLLMLVLQ